MNIISIMAVMVNETEMVKNAISPNIISLSFPSNIRKWLYTSQIGGAADRLTITTRSPATCVPAPSILYVPGHNL